MAPILSEIFIAYESWQIDEARAQAARGTKIVCLDFLLERELKKRNISVISLRDFMDSETGEEEWWVLAQDVAREWYRLPTMRFFEYGGIRIAEVTEPIMMAEYLMRLFYYVRIYIALKKAYPGTHLTIPTPVVEDTSTSECLVSFEQRAILDAARMVGFSNTILSRPIAPQKHSFPRIKWKSLFVRAYNRIIVFIPHVPLRTGRRFKIYASEYWSHIGSVMEQMDDVDLVLMDNNELTHIPWRQLFKHRIRARHPDDAVRPAERRAARRVSEEFIGQWKVARKDVAAYLVRVRPELDWSPVLEACEYLMTYAPRVITYIDATRRILQEEKPDIVLQLGSLCDRYHYFFIPAHVAAQLKIPSIELQHASAFIDPRVAYSRIENEYLATYGADAKKWHERLGQASSRLIPVGAPRYDQYCIERDGAFEKGKQLLKQLGLDPARPVLLVPVPYTAPMLFHFDSYQLAEFFKAIREVQRTVPDLQILFKCRNYKFVGMVQEYTRKLFHVDYAVAGDEDIFALLCASDAVVCGNSTVIYQTMLAKKPLILYGWKSFDTYNVQMYTSAVPFVRTAGEAVHTLARVFADSSYRNELLARQEQFLKGYSFDGKSAQRVAALLRKISQTKSDSIAEPAGLHNYGTH